MLTIVGVIHTPSIEVVYIGCLTSPYGPVTISSSLVFLKRKVYIRCCMNTCGIEGKWEREKYTERMIYRTSVLTRVCEGVHNKIHQCSGPEIFNG